MVRWLWRERPQCFQLSKVGPEVPSLRRDFFNCLRFALIGSCGTGNNLPYNAQANTGAVMKRIFENWQKFLFAVFGFAPLYFSFVYLSDGKVTEASAAFGIAFLSFIYSNLSQFKRFKGLGFEAELWEDKQREAEALIDRLKNVVAIYSSQIVMNNIKRGRWGDGEGWRENWYLFDALVEQHDALGQKIDFSELKKFADDYFLFDMCSRNSDKILKSVQRGHSEAKKKIDEEFGSPIKDSAGFGKRLAEWREIEISLGDNALKISKTGNLAKAYIELATVAKTRLKRDFDIDIEIDQHELGRLTRISELYENRPVKITEELIEWATRKD